MPLSLVSVGCLVSLCNDASNKVKSFMRAAGGALSLSRALSVCACSLLQICQLQCEKA